MKRLLCIVFAGMLLLSGMHLSLATHICGGKVAGEKWSFSGERAGCGMKAETSPLADGFHSSCCQDQLAFYAVDSNYHPSTMPANEPLGHFMQVLYFPENIGIPISHAIYALKTNVRPPGSFAPAAVSLPDICVFRI